jgi:hypothetical protein
MAALSGCASREFSLEDSEIPWEAQGIDRVSVPAFESQPNAWVAAEAARQAIVQALSRGTVQIVEQKAQATLHGALPYFREGTTPGAPRRVLRTSGTGSLLSESYAWEMDVTHLVELKVVVRLVTDKDKQLWTQEAFGTASETSSVQLNWPGSDPVPPPAVMPYPADPSVFTRLRERALDQATQPLVNALTMHYGYRPLK